MMFAFRNTKSDIFSIDFFSEQSQVAERSRIQCSEIKKKILKRSHNTLTNNNLKSFFFSFLHFP
jgi:hypothetical protein